MGTTAMGTLLRPIMAYAQLGIAPQRLLFIHRSDGTMLGTANDADSIAASPEFAGPLRGALERFIGAIRAQGGDNGNEAR